MSIGLFDEPTLCGLPLSRPLIMGILNATPDSFSDGGQHDARVAERVAELVTDGADILDIGGESTRPGADLIPAEEEWSRVAPAIEAAKDAGAVVSIDTRKAIVAERALAAGAMLFNDVSALSFDEGSMKVAAAYSEAGGAISLMHASGDPKTMQSQTDYINVVAEVMAYLGERIASCEMAGVPRRALVIDPGIGFGKTSEHNLTLLKRLKEFERLGCPVLLGVSRKGFIGKVSGEDEPQRRLPGSLAAALHAVSHDSAAILRVHDVRETVQALALWDAIKAAPDS